MSYPSRTICSALDDMRSAYKTYNFSIIASLIEEVQMLANRMEASIDTEQTYSDRRDKLRLVQEDIKTAKEELDSLKRELKLLTKVKELK